MIEVISLPKPKVGYLIMNRCWGSAKGFRFLSLGTVRCIGCDSQTALGPTGLPIRLIQVTLLLDIRRPEGETNASPASPNPELYLYFSIIVQGLRLHPAQYYLFWMLLIDVLGKSLQCEEPQVFLDTLENLSAKKSPPFWMHSTVTHRHLTNLTL